MKTLIEIYDNDYLKNVTAALALDFQEVHFICVNQKPSAKIDSLKQIIEKNKNCKVRIHHIVNSRLENLYPILETIHQDVYVNLTGGYGIDLINMSTACNKKGYRTFFIDHDHKDMMNVSGSKDIKAIFKYPKLSIADLIFLSGSKISNTQHYQIDLNNHELVNDVLRVFEIIQYDFRYFTNVMSDFIKLMSIEKNNIADTKLYIPKNQVWMIDNKVFHQLENLDLLYFDKQKSMMSFKNKIIKHLFKDAGAWLENYTYIKLKQSGFLDDCMVSAIIDYDGRINAGNDARCEIDVLACKDMYPIFISCKMNKVDAEALNEIKLHSIIFGNSYSKCIIVTGAHVSKSNPIIYNKAKELGIYIIDSYDLKNDLLVKKVQEICNNTYEYKKVM